MNRRLERVIGSLIRFPLLLVGFVFVKGYGVLLGWWLDRLLARREERKLERDIREALPFLFDRYHGRKVPTFGVQFPPPFNYAFVTIAVDDLLLRFSRGRGDFEVRVASKDAPTVWHDLSLLLEILGGKEDLQRSGILNLRDAARLLESEIERLRAAFAAESGGGLKQRLAQIYMDDQVAMREAEWEINRRLRP